MNADWIDYYEILECSFGCSEEEIKKSYRTLQRKYHPDSKEADAEKSKLVNIAYEVLGDKEKRAAYDETYMQYKNGEFTEEDVNEDIPKYTHEEMHEAFTEEEIRFAKRVALQQTIAETLENAKIIIDAKNELLFAAFNDHYDKKTYKQEYKEFIAITNDFIGNLRDLIQQAIDLDLAGEVDTIEQVISFLKEVMESIPESLKDAKRKVKLELMMEQLKQETEEAIEEAEKVRKEFIGLYAKVVSENIEKEQFKMYYRMLKIGMTDAISKLNTLYDLLKEAKMNKEFEVVGDLMGKLNEDIRLYTGDYKVALEIGERENLKATIQQRMLSFAEYKAKMLDIMSQIIDNPNLDDVKLQVTKSRAITNEYRDNFTKIDNDVCKKSPFSKDAKDIYKKAKVIFSRRVNLHDKLTQAFSNIKYEELNDEAIQTLKEDVQFGEEEIEALKLLKEVYVLCGQHKEYVELTSSDLKKLIKEVNRYGDKSSELQAYVENMYEYIDDVYRTYQELQKELEKYQGQNIADLVKNAGRYDDVSNSLKTVAGWLFVISMGAGFIFGDYELERHFLMIPIPDDIFSIFLRSFAIYFPGILFAASFALKNSTERERIKEFREMLACQTAYEDLLKGNDSYLQNIYQRALRV